MTIAELINTSRKERTEFILIIEQLTPEQIERPGVSGNWSVHALVGHMPFWDKQVIVALEHLRKDPSMASWQLMEEREIKQYNIQVLQVALSRPFVEVWKEVLVIREELWKTLSSLEEHIPNVIVGYNNYTLQDLIYDDAIEHDRKLRSEIERWLFQQGVVYSQLYNQTDFKGNTSGIYSTGSGDVNVLVANLGEAIAVIKRLIPTEQTDAVERLINALRQLSLHQKVVNELKCVHNILHKLETALATLESSIRVAVMQKKIFNFYTIEETWRIAIRPQIRDLQYFASQEMKFLEEPRFMVTVDGIVGPSWFVDLFVIQNDFEMSLKERNNKEIYELACNVVDECREQMFRVDRQLLEAINRLDQLSDQILRSINDGSTKA